MFMLNITEDDFYTTFGKDQVSIKLKNEKIPILGVSESVNTFLEMLPKVISRKLSNIIPENFRMHEIEMELDIQGTPFGVGVNGKVILRFGPQD